MLSPRYTSFDNIDASLRKYAFFDRYRKSTNSFQLIGRWYVIMETWKGDLGEKVGIQFPAIINMIDYVDKNKNSLAKAKRDAKADAFEELKMCVMDLIKSGRHGGKKYEEYSFVESTMGFPSR